MTHTAALFDLDGTLIDSEQRNQAAWTLLFRRHGVFLGQETLRGFCGRPGRTVLREHAGSFPGREIEDLYEEVLAISAGDDVPPVRPLPGAADYLLGLGSTGVRLGVVTSATGDYARKHLAALGVLAMLDVVITADDVHRGKPHPEGYLAGCAVLRTTPSSTVVFEDSPAGVSAAKNAGAYCVAVATLQPPVALAHADLVVPGFTDLDWPLDAAHEGSRP